MDLSIICVNWNSLEYLRECLAGVFQNTRGISFEIIVVDNASPEGGVETLLEKFPEIVIVRSAENVGFARANNLGFQRALGEYVLLLNPDTELRGPAVNILVENARALGSFGIIGGKLLNTDLTVQTQAIQTFPTILNQLVNIESLRLRWPGCWLWNIAPLFVKNGKPVKVEVIPGACMLLKSAVFRKVGMFSEEYFMYAEDIDLNWKVRALDLANYYIEDAEIVHHGGRSSSRQLVSQWSTMMMYTAMLSYYRKNRSPFYAAMYRLAMGISALLRLGILMVMYPFVDKQMYLAASAKWRVVLQWAVGRSNLQTGQKKTEATSAKTKAEVRA
jgi:N-acetylglucosaminyl-diphospho-decaprenol L-rhamnosyltransferase